MAILSPIKKDDKDELGTKQLGTSSSPTVLPSSTGIAQAPKPTSSGRFSNISNYLKANQNTNLAGKIAGNVQNVAGQASEAVGQAKQQFGGQAQRFGQQLQQGQQIVKQGLQDPTKFIEDQNNVNKFQNALNVKYAGPQNLANQEALQAQVQNVRDLSNQTGSESGRFNLLRSMFNKPSYTGGQQKLDQLLLQANPGQVGALNATKRVASNAQRDLTQGSTEAANTAQRLAQDALRSQIESRNQLTGSAQDVDKALADRVQQKQDELNNKYSGFRTRLSNAELNDEELAKLGLKEGDYLYGTDLANMLGDNNLKATKQNVATAQDYQKLSALNKLAGDYTNPELSKTLETYKGQEAQAGGADKYNPLSLIDPNNVQIALAANQRERRDPIAYNTSQIGSTGEQIQGIQSAIERLKQANPTYGNTADMLKSANLSNLGEIVPTLSNNSLNLSPQQRQLLESLRQNNFLTTNASRSEATDYYNKANSLEDLINQEQGFKSAREAALKQLLGQQIKRYQG